MGVQVLLDNGVEKKRKLIDQKSSIPTPIKRRAVSIIGLKNARSKCFWKLFGRKGLIDLSKMAPCAVKLHPHVVRSAYVAKTFKNTDQLE